MWTEWWEQNKYCRDDVGPGNRDVSNKTSLSWGKTVLLCETLALCFSEREKRSSAHTLQHNSGDSQSQYFLFSLLLRLFKESVALLSVCHLPSLRFLSRARCRWRPGTPRPSGGRCIPSWSRPSQRTTDGPGCLKTLLDWNQSQCS